MDQQPTATTKNPLDLFADVAQAAAEWLIEIRGSDRDEAMAALVMALDRALSRAVHAVVLRREGEHE